MGAIVISGAVILGYVAMGILELWPHCYYYSDSRTRGFSHTFDVCISFWLGPIYIWRMLPLAIGKRLGIHTPDTIWVD